MYLVVIQDLGKCGFIYMYIHTYIHTYVHSCHASEPCQHVGKCAFHM
jgi:hypothetical protein